MLRTQGELIWLRDVELPQLEKDIQAAETAIVTVKDKRSQWQKAVSTLPDWSRKPAHWSIKTGSRGTSARH